MTVRTHHRRLACPATTGPQAAEPEAQTVTPWKPPLDAAGLTDVHGLLLRWAWTAHESEDLLDDVATALDDIAPSEDVIEDFVQRSRGHLMRLVNIAVSTRAWQESAYANTLIQRARTLRASEMPGDYRHAVLHLRQMGWVVGELLDQLVAFDSIKGVA
ncbi:hypothetical protein C8250_039105 [Streptomyces sp. So13.3]|uniref:DUF6415 family natural product biosynthesis protein n=1 Tax=Streptomyces TaxID=1883 RepID=UPI001105DA85|nr:MULTISPECIES: DUF6415 family natural product biosynthesis protein [Streptomyces]MCZ4102952.1 DUF6415 family natural product biosynthesis protein [Streptomyces sp. H39-C1]QNA77068.1 hypothetical protein C8250_039105 [Streptomyces sp. So13.3]